MLIVNSSRLGLRPTGSYSISSTFTFMGIMSPLVPGVVN